LVSAPPLAASHSIVSREEKVEYRDQDGNLLDLKQVKALEGKVSFKTRYETRTRMVDEAGNEIPIDSEYAGVAPPHPDVEGIDPETAGIPEPDVKEKPAVQRDVKADESKEDSIAKSDTGVAKPASEGNEATGA
jgi:dolichyl-phosphate-mannose-protein mannosyltransferase